MPALADERPLETITYDEYKIFPAQIKSLYVAGVLDGMSFMTYNYKIQDHSKWIDCVRTTTLEQTIKELDALLENEPKEQENPLPWAISKVIGNRDCPR